MSRANPRRTHGGHFGGDRWERREPLARPAGTPCPLVVDADGDDYDFDAEGDGNFTQEEKDELQNLKWERYKAQFVQQPNSSVPESRPVQLLDAAKPAKEKGMICYILIYLSNRNRPKVSQKSTMLLTFRQGLSSWTTRNPSKLGHRRTQKRWDLHLTKMTTGRNFMTRAIHLENPNSTRNRRRLTLQSHVALRLP